jgi:hypothetical protein
MFFDDVLMLIVQERVIHVADVIPHAAEYPQKNLTYFFISYQFFNSRFQMLYIFSHMKQSKALNT